VDWSRESMARVTRTILKKYNAEIHSQSTLEGVLELRDQYHFREQDVKRVDVDIFDVAYHIIGGGEEGAKTVVHTKEEADHSLPYMVAVAIIDGQVMPEQYRAERIMGQDVQGLLRRVFVQPSAAFSQLFPQEMPSRVSIALHDGRVLVKEKRDYEGFYTRPMRWDTVVTKFERLSAPFADATLRSEIVAAVANLETIKVADLTRLLSRVPLGKQRGASQA
jgi:2-methylcitrate dehydratase